MAQLILSPKTAGPYDPVTGTITNNFVDLTTINAAALSIVLSISGGTSGSGVVAGTITHFIPNVQVLNSDQITFKIPRLNDAPFYLTTGTYDIWLKYITWEVYSTDKFHIVANSTTGTGPGVLSGLITSWFNFTRFLQRIPLIIAANVAKNQQRNILTQASNQYLKDALDRAMSPDPQVPEADKISVKPLSDGINVFPEISTLFNEAEDYCFILMWAFDEHMSFSVNGPEDPNGETIEFEIKRNAARLATNGKPRAFRILLWDETLENAYQPKSTDVGNLVEVRASWREIKNLTDGDFISYMRTNNCGEKEQVLLDFFNEYKEIGFDDNHNVIFPSGILVCLQDHTTRGLVGSHHQKVVLTDKAAYIGGLNFLKDYWDTNEHFFNDPKLATSEGTGSGASGTRSRIHDTGAIVKGLLLGEVVQTFITRWDQEVANKSEACFTHLIELLESERSGMWSADRARMNDLIQSLKNDTSNTLVGQTFAPHGGYDPDHIVDEAKITVSLPKNSGWAGSDGITEIKDTYYQKLDVLDQEGSFLYIETQYFPDNRMAEAIHFRWKNQWPGLEGKFAYIVIPYKPSTTPYDVAGHFEADGIMRKEMENLKWLEVSTAQTIYIRDRNTQLWEEKYKIRDARQHVSFVDQSFNFSPVGLSSDTELKLTEAYKVNPDGSTDPDPERNVILKVGDILTDSAIMSYVLISGAEIDPVTGNDVPLRTNHFNGSPKERLRETLKKFEIYPHSKTTLFLNVNGGNKTWATVGSANLNRRSLDDDGDQDSEMNIWWSKHEHIMKFYVALWKEHLNDPRDHAMEPFLWNEKGWRNLNHIMKGEDHSIQINGNVVRLDVVDRYNHLK